MKRGLCVCLCMALLGASGAPAAAAPADGQAGGAKASLYQIGQDILGRLGQWPVAPRPEAQAGETAAAPAETSGTSGSGPASTIPATPAATPAPTAVPKATRAPTAAPTATPRLTATPTPMPTPEPTATLALVVEDATAVPTASPSPLPSSTPSPTPAPTPEPTPEPTPAPEGIMPVVRWWPMHWLLLAMAALLCASVLCLLWAARRGKRPVAKLPPYVDGESTLDTEKQPSKGKKEKGGDA